MDITFGVPLSSFKLATVHSSTEVGNYHVLCHTGVDYTIGRTRMLGLYGTGVLEAENPASLTTTRSLEVHYSGMARGRITCSKDSAV